MSDHNPAPMKERPDHGAVFAAALSLWEETQKAVAADEKLDLSEEYNGMDEFMRHVMRIATRFEEWACAHVAFGELRDRWPYLLQDRFGKTCLELFPPQFLFEFHEDDCLPIALALRVPVIVDDVLRVPMQITVKNPHDGSGFTAYRIATYRNLIEDNNEPCTFSVDCEPYDENYGDPYFRLSGLAGDQQEVPIADRATYAEVLALARKIAGHFSFPDVVTSESS